MGICWQLPQDDSGILMAKAYDDPIQTKHPECTQKVIWKKDQLPLKYYIDTWGMHPDYIEDIENGAKLWNKTVKVPLLIRTKNVGEATGRIRWGEPTKYTGQTTHTGNETGLIGFEVIIRNASNRHTVYKTAAHEFGHVLGLAHDESPRTLMYPYIPEIIKEISFVLPSDNDIELLRKTYGK